MPVMVQNTPSVDLILPSVHTGVLLGRHAFRRKKGDYFALPLPRFHPKRVFQYRYVIAINTCQTLSSPSLEIWTSCMTSSQSHTSLTLLGRVEANDRGAWELFVQLYGPLVYSWCRGAGFQQSDAEDVGQEVFRTVLSKLGTFTPGRKQSGAFRSWLWGIARFEMLMYLRAARQKPIAQGGSNHNLWIQQLEAEPLEPVSVSGVSPQQLLLQSAISIMKLEFDPRTWQAFWDMAVNGRTSTEIGEELDMTPKAVRQAKFRVTKKLRTLIDEDFSYLAEISSESKG